MRMKVPVKYHFIIIPLPSNWQQSKVAAAAKQDEGRCLPTLLVDVNSQPSWRAVWWQP